MKLKTKETRLNTIPLRCNFPRTSWKSKVALTIFFFCEPFKFDTLEARDQEQGLQLSYMYQWEDLS